MPKNNQNNEVKNLIHFGNIIQNNSNGDATEENQKQIIKLLNNLSIYGNKEKFLEEYFGKKWKEDLVNPKTYKNLKKLLNNTNKTLIELQNERKELLEKIKAQRLHSSLQDKIDKAIRELRYEDARKILDTFLKETQYTIQDSYKAHYQKALTYLEEMLYYQAKEEIEFIPSSKVTDIKILKDYSYIYQLCGNNQEALLLQKRILEISEKTLKKNNLATIEPHTILSNLYITIGLINESKKHCDILFEISEKIKTEESNNYYLGEIYTTLADLYLTMGDYSKSESMYHKSFDAYQSINSDDEHLKSHYKLKAADTYSKLSDLYRIAKLYEEAEDLQSWSIIVKTGILGLNSLTLAQSYNNLGLLYTDMREFDKAKENYQMALEIRKKLLGEIHYRTATIYHNMALMYQNMLKYEKSEQLYNKALKIYKQSLGEEHPYVANVYNNLAMLYHMSNWGSQDAYDFMLKAIEIRSKVLPENHSDLVYSKTWFKAIKNAINIRRNKENN